MARTRRRGKSKDVPRYSFRTWKDESKAYAKSWLDDLFSPESSRMTVGDRFWWVVTWPFRLGAAPIGIILVPGFQVLRVDVRGYPLWFWLLAGGMLGGWLIGLAALPVLLLVD
jgi:hypothetical protein